MNKKKNIFLDLDQTIICSEEYSPEIMSKIYGVYDYDFIDKFVTVSRPHLEVFLHFLFKHFNVCIWTAGSKIYASFIYDRFIKRYDPKRELKLLLFNNHCDYSFLKTGHTKDLSMLWNVWKLEDFNKENTFIIDDLKEVFTTQPENCFRIKEFYLKNGQNDTELLSMIERITKELLRI